jgi:type I restriction enzyme, S subunit
MSSEWRTVQLSQVASEVTVGFVGTMANEYIDSGIPFLRSLNIDKFKIDTADIKYISPDFHSRISKSRLRPGDVVIVRTGKPGTCAVIPDDLPESNCSDLVIVRCGSEILNRFLCYYVNSAASNHIAAHLVGAVQQHFNVASAKAMKIPLPSMREQKAIAHILGTLDDKIELNRKTNETLEAMAKALFKSWFVDFDPVRAKSEGRSTGLPAEISNLFPDSFEDSELGEIPSEWDVGTIGDSVGEVFDGPHATPKEASDGNIFLGIKNMTGTSLDLTEKRLIGLDDWQQWTRRVVPRGGDIVFTYEAALGLFAVIPFGLKCCLGRRMALVRPRGDDATTYFWFHQFVAEAFQRLIEERSIHGATVNRTPLTEFPSYPVLVPDAKIRTVFESTASTLWSRIHLASSEAEFLVSLRNALLPKLISGEIRIPDVEKMLEEVGV